MLSEEKKQQKLINANIIIRHNAIVISCDEQCEYPVSAYFSELPEDGLKFSPETSRKNIV